MTLAAAAATAQTRAAPPAAVPSPKPTAVLIDNHVHLVMAASTMAQMTNPNAKFEVLEARGAEEARQTLLRGFTTVRDMGGPVFGIKKAIDANKAEGPRIYPSGAMVSQTSGHGDTRLPHERSRCFFGSEKKDEVIRGTDNAFKWARQPKVKRLWGTDFLFSPALGANQTKDILKMKTWFAQAEVLKLVTHDNAQVLLLSGPRNPHPGKLGVVEPRALAELVLVDGDPLANLDLLADPAKNFVVSMKDGKVHKHSIRP